MNCRNHKIRKFIVFVKRNLKINRENNAKDKKYHNVRDHCHYTGE